MYADPLFNYFNYISVEFEQWKAEEERITSSYYVKGCGQKLIKKKFKVEYFYCNRSGFF